MLLPMGSKSLTSTVQSSFVVLLLGVHMAQWEETRPSEDFYRILAPDGQIQREPPDFTDNELIQLYRTFVQTRAFEDKTFRMQRRGELSITARARGEEATPLGSVAALEPGDWCFPSYRQTPASLYWDVPMDRTIASLMGAAPETINEHLPLAADEQPAVNFTPPYVPLAVNVTNAVGSAMTDALTDTDTVTLSYIGDGSTSQGDFHAALNVAGVFDAPAVTICQNNQWAISVPSHQQTAAETFAQKAEAYGVPHERVDGNDVLAVYQKTNEAVKRARSGGGPTFIECVTYRMGEHNTADEESIYRSEQEQEYWADRDPVDRFETYLCEKGLLTDESIATINEDMKARVQEAVDTARAVPASNPERIFDNHLHGESWRKRHQRAELQAEQEGRNPFIANTEEWTPRSATPDRSAGEHGQEMNLVTAVNHTLRQEMACDERVRIAGYDIGPIGGVYRATEGLYDEFGPERVIEMPLSENAILGTAVGMALRGQRVVPEIQFMGFFYPAFGQFMYTLAKMHERSGGQLEVPLTVRIPYGGGIKSSEYHSESTETYLIHTPGVRVVCPSTPSELKGLLTASIQHPDPVMFLEPKKIYRGVTESVPDNEYTLPLDQARCVRMGSDVTLLTWGAMVRHAVTAADAVDGDIEIIDLRSLAPLDVETIVSSVQKTGRCVVLHEARRTLGLGSELAALINKHAFDRLKAPVERATGYDVHFPGHQTEDEYLPDAERTQHAIETVMNYKF
jgi:pyruvate/2-oxoglutarate/acetoin dehydrogenase E1 component/TPP-dependent pyruvate/acetoin dehydrogenase alpha subunit